MKLLVYSDGHVKFSAIQDLNKQDFKEISEDTFKVFKLFLFKMECF